MSDFSNLDYSKSGLLPFVTCFATFCQLFFFAISFLFVQHHVSLSCGSQHLVITSCRSSLTQPHSASVSFRVLQQHKDLQLVCPWAEAMTTQLMHDFDDCNLLAGLSCPLAFTGPVLAASVDAGNQWNYMQACGGWQKLLWQTFRLVVKNSSSIWVSKNVDNDHWRSCHHFVNLTAAIFWHKVFLTPFFNAVIEDYSIPI